MTVLVVVLLLATFATQAVGIACYLRLQDEIRAHPNAAFQPDYYFHFGTRYQLDILREHKRLYPESTLRRKMFRSVLLTAFFATLLFHWMLWNTRLSVLIPFFAVFQVAWLLWIVRWLRIYNPIPAEIRHDGGNG